MSDDGQPPLDEPLAAAGDLPTFLGSAGALTLDDRRTLVGSVRRSDLDREQSVAMTRAARAD